MKIQISAELFADELIVADVDGKYHALADGQAFRYDCPILFCVADMTDVESIYPDSAIIQGDIEVHEDLVPYKPVYVEGYFSNSILEYPMFAPVKITQELPSEDNRTQCSYKLIILSSHINLECSQDIQQMELSESFINKCR